MNATTEPLGLATEEHTCRICQLEGTEDHQLFHPCKCRGSIKYIHQDCLEEWLKRSGRDGRCDICHEEYKFTTVYLENTPGVAPLKLITLKARSHIVRLIHYVTAYSSLIFGTIQIPLFWAISRRFIDWIIDGNTTHDDFFVALIYGDADFSGDPYSFENLNNALRYTFVSSVTFLFYFVAVHLLLFLEHEWVSKDPGFQKLIRKYIGTDGRPQRVDIDQNIANILDQDGVLRNPQLDPQNPELRPQRLRNLNELQRALRNPNLPENLAADRLVQLLIQREEHIHQRGQAAVMLDDNDDHEDPDFVPSDDEDNTDESDDEDDDEEEEEEARAVFERFARFDNERNNEARRNAANEVPDIPNIPNARVEAFPPFNPIRPINQPRREPVIARDPERVGEERQPIAVADNADDLIINAPIFLIIVVADCFLGAYLIVAYLVPSLLGTLVFQLSALLLSNAVSLLFKITDLLKITPFINQKYNAYVTLKKSVPVVDSFLENYVISPVWNVLIHVYEQKGPLTKVERFLPLVLFYGICLSGILLYIKIKSDEHGPAKPLRGLQRKLFIALFDLVSTSKVFLIFFTELYLFPTFCGLLLEFALTPIFETKSRLIFNNLFFVHDFFMLRLFISWAVGTAYMCLFALYVGMCRRYILRPGLLFFIRSPEDPNARLVHDALVRPLGLQLSRICLSGLVYTLFILIGFGVVSHSLKATGTPLLPIRIGFVSNSLYGLIVALVAASSIYHRLEIIKKYVRQYWGRAYKISASKTRLSSFIIGNHDLKERGYIVYRDLSARFNGAKPDYAKPTSLYETKEIFQTTNVQSCFVPDGNLVRAPRNDTVSRKFVKSLFIPVTKDDIPLQSDTELRKDLAKRSFDEFDESEDELVTTNNYEIVYRPPLFGARVISFILLLWVFSVFLICGVAIAANIIGKPIVLLFEGLNKILKLEPYGLLRDVEEYGLLESILRMDVVSLASGLQILSVVLEKADKHIIRNHLQEEGELDEDDVLNNRFARFKDNVVNAVRFLVLFLIYFGSQVYMMAWNNMIHFQGINKPLAHYQGLENDDVLVLNQYTYPLHIFVFLFTYLQWLLLITTNPNEIVRNGNLRGVALKSLVYALERFASTHLIVILGKISLGLYEYHYYPQHYTSLTAAMHFIIVEEGIHKDLIVYMWPVILVTVGSIHLLIRSFRYFQKINAEVKEEFYSRGKTLENKDVVEQSTDRSTSAEEVAIEAVDALQ